MRDLGFFVGFSAAGHNGFFVGSLLFTLRRKHIVDPRRAWHYLELLECGFTILSSSEWNVMIARTPPISKVDRVCDEPVENF